MERTEIPAAIFQTFQQFQKWHLAISDLSDVE